MVLIAKDTNYRFGMQNRDLQQSSINTSQNWWE